MPILGNAIAIAGGITGVIGAFFAVRKMYLWAFPVKVSASVFMSFEREHSDQIEAKVTNRTNESLYITRCNALSAHTSARIIRAHVRKPFLNPRLYRTVWFGGQSYKMMASATVKIEPNQPAHFSYKLNFNVPLSIFLAPMVQVEVHLSSGRVIRSKKLSVPESWKLKPRNKSRKHKMSHHTLDDLKRRNV